MNDLREAEIATGGSYRNLLVSVMGLGMVFSTPKISLATFETNVRS
jgi:hypothetical protein